MPKIEKIRGVRGEGEGEGKHSAHEAEIGEAGNWGRNRPVFRVQAAAMAQKGWLGWPDRQEASGHKKASQRAGALSQDRTGNRSNNPWVPAVDWNS